MSWARYDDRFHDHPKVLAVRAADPGAIALHVLANTWTHGNGQRGLVPTAVPAILVSKRRAVAWVAILVRHGLWEVVEGGWRFHDWAQYSADGSQQRRAAAARWGDADAKRTHSGRTPAHVRNDATREESPVPGPVPVGANAPSVRASRWLGRGEEPVEVYAARCVELGLGTPPDDELGLISRKARAAIGRGELMADVLAGCRAAAVKNQAGLLDRLIGDAKRARLGIVTNDRAGAEGPTAPRPPRLEERRELVDWDEQRAGLALVGDVLKRIPTEPVKPPPRGSSEVVEEMTA